ncbi:MAG TPA: hypothetical protein VMM57_01560 [Bacteroidota bacterium]|nr:hypothetical protein [Bacteroidota bacterium]
MKKSRFWIAVLAGGVVGNLLDGIVQGYLLERVYYEKAPDVFRMSQSPTWFALGDFLAALILGWVYDRVVQNFKPGVRGGMLFGLYAGLISGIPFYFFNYLMIRGYELSLAAVSTVYMIIWYVIVAAAISLIYRRESSVGVP